MGVQPRSLAMPTDNDAAKSPSMQTVTSPVTRKRRYMDVVLVHPDANDGENEERALTQRVSFKRAKAGETELRVQVHDHDRTASLEPITPTSSASSTGSPDTTSPSVKTPARPNMSASQTITLDMLRPHFEKPLAQVAQVFGICVTLLKKICRKNGLARWPHRQIIGLRKSIASMEQAIGHFEGARRESYAHQLDKQRNKLTLLLKDPTACNMLAVEDEYVPAYAAADTAEQTLASPPMPPMPQPSYYTASAPPTPVYERAPSHYMDYYHHAPSPASQHVAYVPHQYPPAYAHGLYHHAAAYPRPSVMLPPLRTDACPVLPSLSALVARRW